MLPRMVRNRMLEHMSTKTMRKQFQAVTRRNAAGIAARVLEQAEEDFFINGTITCHAACPQHMAGMWSGGRETTLVGDRLPAWLKKAMGAALSRQNQCPYCVDMLVALTFGAEQPDVASSIQRGRFGGVQSDSARAIIEWAEAAVNADDPRLEASPFGPDELPEAIGTLLVFSYTNKITDLTIHGSPVAKGLKGLMLRILGTQLAESARRVLEPGRSLALLPSAPVPPDLYWAAANPRVADALARWIGVVDDAVDDELPASLRHWLQDRIDAWRGGQAPLSRAWVDDEVASLAGADRDKARLALLVVRAAYQIDDGIIDSVLAHGVDAAGVVKLGSWAALSAARRVATWTADAVSAR